MLTSEHNDKAKNDYVISEPKLGIGNINYGGIEMARGRPRGNKTQREIGRAVGKGLKGKSIENPFKAERKVVSEREYYRSVEKNPYDAAIGGVIAFVLFLLAGGIGVFITNDFTVMVVAAIFGGIFIVVGILGSTSESYSADKYFQKEAMEYLEEERRRRENGEG